MKTAEVLLLLIFSLCTALPVSAQTDKKDDDDEVLKIETQLVDVPVVVTDKAGRALLDLKAANFTILEDGRKQDLAGFSTTSAPFEVALLLDTSGSTRADLELIKATAQSFINSLRPGDRVAIIAYRTDGPPENEHAVSEVLQDLTNQREALKTALGNVKTSHGTPYYDSLVQVVEKVFNQRPQDQFRGRRALVALTDGVDSNSVNEFEAVKTGLGKAGLSSYFVKVDTREYFEDKVMGDCHSSLWFSRAQLKRYYNKFYPQANFERIYDFCMIGEFERLDITEKLYQLADTEMNELAKISGGRVFPVADLRGAKTAFDKVAQEIGTKYSLGYYSDNEKKDGSYRKISVQIKGLPPGSIVRAREGYNAPRN
jgi:Ca-activated chloride channel family protein